MASVNNLHHGLDSRPIFKRRRKRGEHEDLIRGLMHPTRVVGGFQMRVR